MKKLVLALCLASASTSYADSGAPVAVLVDAGVSDAAPAPSSALHDPVKDPGGAISDVKAAKARWPLMVLVILIGLTKIAAYAGGKFAPIGSWLSTGKRATYLAAAGALAATLYDSLASGGTWGSALLVIGGAVLALISPHAPAAAQDKAKA